MLPCNYIHTALGYTGDEKSDKCNDSLEAQQQYLGPLNMIVYFNQESFNANEYFEKSIIKESKIMTQQISEYTQTFFQFKLQTNSL